MLHHLDDLIAQVEIHNIFMDFGRKDALTVECIRRLSEDLEVAGYTPFSFSGALASAEIASAHMQKGEPVVWKHK